MDEVKVLVYCNGHVPSFFIDFFSIRGSEKREMGNKILILMILMIIKILVRYVLCHVFNFEK